MRLKAPDLITFKGVDAYVHGKVSVDFSINQEDGHVIAPYSLAGESANVATPLLWDEVNAGLRPEDFNHETIFSRLKKSGDPLDSLFKKKVNADALVERFIDHYSFLL
jgi:bifunctional non-homologous end joining protein LigD